MNRDGSSIGEMVQRDESYVIGMHDIVALEKHIRVLKSFLCKINLLYASAIRKNDEHFLSLVETGILKQKSMRDWHRRLFIDRPPVLPQVMRLDMPRLDAICEYHAGYKGLGTLIAMRQKAEREGRVDGYFTVDRWQRFISLLQASLFAGGFEYYEGAEGFREIEDFLGLFCEGDLPKINVKEVGFGKQYRALRKTIVFRSPQLLYRGAFHSFSFYWNDYLQSLVPNKAYEIFRRYVKNDIVLDPPPNLLYENKVVTAIVSDARYADFFTLEERALFPQTVLLDKHASVFLDGKKLTLAALLELPKKKHRFVVKYAGLDLRLNFGGKRVYDLQSLSRRQKKALIHNAIKKYEKCGEPWILQERVDSAQLSEGSRSTRYEQQCKYKLFRPYVYFPPRDEDPFLVDMRVFYRNYYKVTANSDCLHGLVATRNMETLN